MSSRASSSVPPSPLGTSLFATAQGSRSAALIGWAVALAAHVGVASGAVYEHVSVAHAPPALEVELAAPEPLPPPPAPPPVSTPAPPPAEPAPTPVTRAAAAAPAPARVGALVTAKADPTPTPGADEPVDFTNDPSLVGFGSGVVAIGGKADHGLAGAKPGITPASAGTGVAAKPAGDALVAASDLSRKPGLGESDPCRGYFPAGASDDVASAAVMVTIARSGAVTSVQLLSESPPKQGFGSAARTCMASKRFSPGLDRDGKPAATAIRVNIRFLR